MSVKYRNVVTVGGISGDVAKSALQKYIRRGLPEEAVSVARDIHKFHTLKDSKSTITNFYNRLRITLLEEIGIAFPNLILIIDPLLTAWREKADESALIRAMSIMATVPHTRYYSHLRAHIRSIPEVDPPVSPLLKSNNPRKNTTPIMWHLENKVWDGCWYWCAKEMQNGRKNTKQLFTDLLRFTPDDKKPIVEKCREWYNSMHMKEQFLPVLHAFATVLMPDIEAPEENKEFEPCVNDDPPSIAEYCYDKHTSVGRRLNLDSIDFALDGSLVAFDENLNPEYHKVYITQRLKEGYVRSEKSEFTLRARAQLTCSKSRPDSYFAKSRLGNPIVVKGPYLTYEDVLKTFQMQSIIGLFMPRISCSIKCLGVDQFPKGHVKIGNRTKADGRSAFFLEMRDLIAPILSTCGEYACEEYPTKAKSSKFWKNEQVVDYEKLYADRPDISFFTGKSMNELFVLGLRWAFEIGDFATRNFLVVGDKAYNLDTEGWFVGNRMRFSKAVRNAMAKTMNESSWKKVLTEWLGPGKGYVSRWILVEKVIGSDGANRVRKNIEKLIDNPKILFS